MSPAAKEIQQPIEKTWMCSRVPRWTLQQLRSIASTSTVRAKENANTVQRSSPNDVQTGGKTEIKNKMKISVFSNARDVPVNINFPNKKGVDGYDPDYPVKDLIKDIPEVVRQQSKLLKEELGDMAKAGGAEKTDMLEDMGFVRHNEARVDYRFNDEKALSLWNTGCDSDWKEGFSTCSLEITDHKTALFRGDISTRVVRDGRVQRAGWASMKLEERKTLNRKKFFTKWNNFSHMLIKVRGDGRSYKVMLHAPLSIDYTWGDSFSYPLHTHGGPYWQYEKIPFSKFFHTVNGRIQDRQYRVNCEDVSSVGIVLMDRIDGPFRLEIDYVGVYNDRTHVEDFAYETYSLPVFNTHGF